MKQIKTTCVLLLLLFAVLEVELRAFILSHSTSPIFVKGLSRQGLAELFALAGFKL
jgi:hypothetical protein